MSASFSFSTRNAAYGVSAKRVQTNSIEGSLSLRDGVSDYE